MQHFTMTARRLGTLTLFAKNLKPQHFVDKIKANSPTGAVQKGFNLVQAIVTAHEETEFVKGVKKFEAEIRDWVAALSEEEQNNVEKVQAQIDEKYKNTSLETEAEKEVTVELEDAKMDMLLSLFTSFAPSILAKSEDIVALSKDLGISEE